MTTARDIRTEEMLLNMGPQHPSTHGVFRVVIRTDGEVVLDAEPHVGYLHRCFEKCAEGNTYVGATPYTDRLDYLSAMMNNLGYSLAVENLMGEPVPERAQFIRIVVAELQRIASHLLAIGTYGLDVGAITPFLYCFRDREKLLKLFEIVCGQRLNYNYVRPGGVAYDLTPDFLDRVRAFVDYFPPKVRELNDLLSYNRIFISRTARVGVIPREMAIGYGCTGPVLRGSGVRRDLRKDEPYCIYDRFDFQALAAVPHAEDPRVPEEVVVGDCWSRYWVRVNEMLESCRIVDQALRGMPREGSFLARWAGAKLKEGRFTSKTFRPPKGEAYLKVENSRGELGFYIVSDGGTNPYRVKCRAPSFHNVSLLREVSRGCMVADMVAIIGSLDIVMGEVDR
ncbi:MAG: NADH-quinone oxidoreductase subunit D [Planctomycetes bacterium]|nr:NADH-quinone oxidoreductase subunit D [Planctomycetota bacterium]